MANKTVYLKIPKESAANKITEQYTRKAKQKDGTIKIYKSGTWYATLKDYKIKSSEIETKSGQAEAGTIGTEMIYKNVPNARKCRKAVSEYEF